MRNVEVLKMIEDNRIEELKSKLRDEVYAEALTSKTGAKKRYTAMKKYFTYTNHAREAMEKPCSVKFNGEDYISFCNSYSLALTKESCGEIEMFTDVERYPDVVRLISMDGKQEKIDFRRVIAEAKSLGYKLNKNEISGYKFKYLMHYKKAYFKIGLLDATYSIIDDGEEATVYSKASDRTPLTIETGLGVAVVMPIRIEEVTDDLVVIEAKEGSK